MTRLHELAQRYAATSPWTNVYGLARTSLAIGTLITLLCNSGTTLFAPAGTVAAPVARGFITSINFFGLFPGESWELARGVAIALLAVVASGWRPRVTGIVHWWIATSVYTASPLIDGGDQVTAVLTLLLLPVCVTDPRRWHWHALDAGSPRLSRQLAAISASLTLVVIRVQVAVIYFHAGVAKLAVDEWGNGTALYYWFTDPVFGMPAWLEPLLMPLLRHPVGVVVLTWGVMGLEIALFLALVMEKKYWRPLLMVGLCFHAGIVVFHGLVSFFFAMSAALILYLRPPEHVIARPRVIRIFR